MGVKFEKKENDTLRVYRSKPQTANIQTNIYPGFPTDLNLQQLFSCLRLTVCGKIHEILFKKDVLGGSSNSRQCITLRSWILMKPWFLENKPPEEPKVSSWDLRSVCSDAHRRYGRFWYNRTR